jgi:hypothetical protein
MEVTGFFVDIRGPWLDNSAGSAPTAASITGTIAND